MNNLFRLAMMLRDEVQNLDEQQYGRLETAYHKAFPCDDESLEDMMVALDDVLSDLVTIGKEIEEDDDPSVVNHPSHYTYSSVEPITAIEAWQLPYHLGNVVKYVSRAGHKDASKTVEDLEKAAWYLDRYIKMLKGKGVN